MYEEYLVERKKNLFDYLIIFLMIFAGITASISLMGFLFVQIYGMFAFIIIAAIWYCVYYVVTSRNIEYEYIITDGVLDIDVITGKRKRKNLVSLNISNAEIIAPASTDYYNEYNKNGIVNTYDASMKNNSIIDFFVIFPDGENGVTRLIFTPSQNILDAIKKYNPRNTFFE